MRAIIYFFFRNKGLEEISTASSKCFNLVSTASFTEVEGFPECLSDLPLFGDRVLHGVEGVDQRGDCPNETLCNKHFNVHLFVKSLLNPCPIIRLPDVVGWCSDTIFVKRFTGRVKKHCQRHNWPKTLSTLTHSTPLVFSSKQKLQQALKSFVWQRARNTTIHVSILTNQCNNLREIHLTTLINPTILAKFNKSERVTRQVNDQTWAR